jgi:predicted RNase H-like nuclease (RuvC/YqgF family)
MGEVWVALATVIAAAITVVGVIYTARASSRAGEKTRKLEEKAVDAQAYERARQSYDAAIHNYLEEIGHLRLRIESLTIRLNGLNNDIAELEDQRRAQRDEIEDVLKRYNAHLEYCESRVNRLRERLAAHEVLAEDDPDLLLPPWLP